MYLRTLSDRLEGYLTAQRVGFVIILLGTIQLVTGFITLLPQFDGERMGGDFVAFWSAGREVFAGRLIGLYAPDGLAAAIASHRPEMAEIANGLTWQYPPHSSLVFSPFGLLPFLPAYLLWCGLGLTAFGLAIRPLGFRPKALCAVLLCPLVLSAIVTGQNGLFTAALFVVAITQIGPRPILAGLAAAGLTVKPQLGLLLPVAYITARAWVPFVTAAIGSAALWASSALVSGKASWFAFFDSVQNVNGAIEAGVMPIYKMVTVYAAMILAGAPLELTKLVYLLAAGSVMTLLAYVWRQTEDGELRLATVSSMALLIAPYAYYYELTLALPALLIVWKRAQRTGWLPFELLSLASVFVASIVLPGPEMRSGISLPFILMVSLTCITLRRVLAELGRQRASGRVAAPIELRKAAL